MGEIYRKTLKRFFFIKSGLLTQVFPFVENLSLVSETFFPYITQPLPAGIFMRAGFCERATTIRNCSCKQNLFQVNGTELFNKAEPATISNKPSQLINYRF